MDTAKLTNSPVGHLTTVSGHDQRFNEPFEVQAFVPNDLPERVLLAPDTYNVVIEATGALARADQAASRLPNPILLARPATRREAVSTSALEGTYAALSDVFEADFLEADQISASVSEVRNYVVAAERAYALLEAGHPISVRLLEDLQRQLLEGTPSDSPHAGSVRQTQVFIGVGGRRVDAARFIPPPADHRLLEGLQAWEKWLRSSDPGLPLLVRAAMGHYQFETLHPFHDGNGRLGRLVIALQLIASGDLRFPVMNVSPWLEQNRSEYQDGLLRVSQTGEWDPWVCFIAAAIHAEALEVVARVDKLLDLREKFQATLRADRVKGVALPIAEDLIGYPMITATTAKDMHGVSYQAANNAIAKLVELGILRQRSEGRYDRIFQSDDVLRALEY